MIVENAFQHVAPKKPKTKGEKDAKRLAKNAGSAGGASEPEFATPQEALRSLVHRHKRWVNTARMYEQSVSDRTNLTTGEPILCNIPDDIRADVRNTAKNLQAEAGRLERLMLKQLKQVPIYTHFLSKVFREGIIISAYLATMVRIERCTKVSQLWRYCGNGCLDGKAERRNSGPKFQPNGVFNPVAGGTFNQELKTRIWQAMTAMRKNAAKKTADRPFGTTSKYLERWYNAKAGRVTMGREKGAEHAARRKATDLFLEDLYIVWRTLEGLPVWPDLYSVRRGFYHGGSPCVNAGRVLTLEEAFAVIGDVGPRAAPERATADLNETDDVAAE